MYYVFLNTCCPSILFLFEVYFDCGNIKASSLLELNASARLVGDICTRQFKVEQGAHFTGLSQLLEEAITPLTSTENSKELYPIKGKKLASKNR